MCGKEREREKTHRASADAAAATGRTALAELLARLDGAAATPPLGRVREARMVCAFFCGARCVRGHAHYRKTRE